MCGICGILGFNPQQTVNEDLLPRMCKVMNYRGPDDQGVHLGWPMPNGGFRIGLGHRRLSIIDLNSGRQPIFNEDKKICIVYNGEIYNYKVLREALAAKGHFFYTKTDTEVIVHLYEEYGVECVKYLQGMFAFAIWDENKKELFLARDRLGKKPLVYAVSGTKLIFASEIKCILEEDDFKREINLESIDLYLTYQYIPSPLTIFKHIKKLPPAGIMVCNEKGDVKISRYWDIDYRNKVQISTSKNIQEEIYSKLENAVKSRMISDVPLGAFLSGGIDSSAIVGIMSTLSDKPVKTFSIGFEEGDFSELKYARMVADLFKTEHHEFMVKVDMLDILPKLVWHYNEPFADSSSIPSYYVANQTRKFVTVALNGDGGDENFGGYDRYRANKMAYYFQKMPLKVQKIVWNYFVKYFPESVGKKSPLRQLKRFVAAAGKPIPFSNIEWHSVFNNVQRKSIYTDEMYKKTNDFNAENYLLQIYNSAKGTDFLDKIFYTDIKSYLPEDLLVKMDIATMANSLETRSPFLDHEFMEFTASLPASWKIKGLTGKYILKKALKGFLPDKIINRSKMGFGVPIGSWFKCELQSYLKEILLSDKSIERGYFKRGEIKNLLEQHGSGKISHTYRIWALLVLEIWHQIFIDKSIKF